MGRDQIVLDPGHRPGQDPRRVGRTAARACRELAERGPAAAAGGVAQGLRRRADRAPAGATATPARWPPWAPPSRGGARILRVHDVAGASDYLRVHGALGRDGEVETTLELPDELRREAGVKPFTIAQLSDLHCGSPHFVPSLLDRAIVEVNELEPDVVVVSGDLTGDGLRGEFSWRAEYLSRIACERMIVIPGNHDSRNVGYVHFEELFGERRSELHQDGVSIVAVDSTEPDLDHGVIGRGRYPWISERFGAHEAFLRIFVLHHHLLPVPGTGRERNVVHDAGDTLECLQRADVHLVLSGHKHVPYAWRLENLFVVNAGTVSTTRLRGKTKPCYNVIEASPERVTVFRKYPFHEQDAILSFDPRTYEYEKDQSLLGETAHG